MCSIFPMWPLTCVVHSCNYVAFNIFSGPVRSMPIWLLAFRRPGIGCLKFIFVHMLAHITVLTFFAIYLKMCWKYHLSITIASISSLPRWPASALDSCNRLILSWQAFIISSCHTLSSTTFTSFTLRNNNRNLDQYKEHSLIKSKSFIVMWFAQ